MARDCYQVLFALCVYYIYVKKLFFSFIIKYILVLKIHFRLKECGQFYLALYVMKMQVWWEVVETRFHLSISAASWRKDRVRESGF